MPRRLATFGEALFRLAAPQGERLAACQHLDFYLGGSELNVALNYASLGGQARWISTLPDDGEGDLIAQRLQGLDLSFVRRAKGRAGYYLHEPGTPPRPDYVPVRRASLFNDTIAKVPWSEALRGCHRFHSSGITAGLGETSRQELREALTECRAQGVKTSYDLNFRSNLWTLQEAREAQAPLLHLIDTLFVSPADLPIFFDGNCPDEVRERLAIEQLVVARRQDHHYQVSLHTDAQTVTSQAVPYHVVDRIGVGDAMVAGFLAGDSLQQKVEWAALSGALAYSLKGDASQLTRQELERARVGGEIQR